jgi:hypothetical protein
MADTNPELEAFLQESTSAPVSSPQETAPPASTGDAPPPSPAPSRAAQDDDDGDDAPPASAEEGVQATVPRTALEDERRKRNDWKEQASRREGENAELRRQLEALQRGATPQPQQPAQPAQPPATPVWRLPEVPIPNPLEDPAGYAQALLYEQRRQLEVDRFNHRLDDSEKDARAKLGDEAVDKLIADFRTWPQSAKDEIFAAKDAYSALHRRATALRLQQEMGDDPEAWRESERQRIRTELEAEIGGTAPAPAATPSRVANLAPSLANARSSAPRSAPAYTGMSLEQMFPPYAERKRKA